MTAVIIRDLPDSLHRRIKADAVRHRRSMNSEIITLLENAMAATQPMELPPPVRGRVVVDGRWIAKVIRDARDGKQ